MGTLNRRLLLLGCLLGLTLWATATLTAESISGQVSWVYDGDTLEVEGVGKVRLLGIDTPEREDSPRDRYYQTRQPISSERLRAVSRAALKFNIRQAKGKLVTLEFDLQKKDRFGRTLAYVYLPDGTLLNRLLVEQGLAATYRRFDFRLKADFLAAEALARSAGIGLWSH